MRSLKTSFPISRRFPASGFALVIVLSLLVLLTLLGVGLLTLSAISLRSGSQVNYQARARENARLAMILALGELQRQAGPDTRATATAAVLGPADTIAQPHWTGVWSTRTTKGGPLLVRDDATGGLKDTRGTPWDREKEVLRWLVSGSESTLATNPKLPAASDHIQLVGPGTVGVENSASEVFAPPVAVAADPKQPGHYAWWVGDLGVKANLATPDAFEAKTPDPADPADGGWFRLMTSQEADATTLAGATLLNAAKKRLLASEQTPNLLKSPTLPATSRYFHDFTTQSDGLLTDMTRGGLKRDLTAYFASNGKVADREGLPGLDDLDNLVGPANAAAATREGLKWTDTRHRFTSPKFGLLRRWANVAAPFHNGDFAGIQPKPEPSPRVAAAKALALANLKPASIAAADVPGIMPILVEGSFFQSISRYRKPAGSAMPWDIRLHYFPRIVLWNPYNIRLTLDRSIAMIQGNGRQEMWTQGNVGATIYQSQWIFFVGGRSLNFDGSILDSTGYVDPYVGSFYFSLPATTFEPGECLVFSPARAAEYSAPVYKKNNPYALDANALSCSLPPHPSRSYYSTNGDIGGGLHYPPAIFWFAPTQWASGGILNQGDDCRVLLKQLGTQTKVTFEDFDALPQLSLLSASLQFGGGREPRIEWNKLDPVVIEETDYANPVLRLPPDVRTREGIRLRWHDEHLSNLEGAGRLKDSPHFEDALIANWNPRAAYATRSPFENIAGSMPNGGALGGPWFFGAYTRDLYDGAVGWNDQTPVAKGGRYHGNPFGPPQEIGGRPIVLFDLPRTGTGVVSIGQFQHAKLSEFVWHPSYAIGNSLADPRLASGRVSGLDCTSPRYTSLSETQKGGFDLNAVGWSSDIQRSSDRESWATQARAIYQDYPTTDNLVYDLSFELNQTLWDGFFLSTGTTYDKEAFLNDPTHPPLPNGRLRPAPVTGFKAKPADLADLHRAAYALSVDGAFNVNSTSVEAWKAVLGATRRLSSDGKSVAFPRILNPSGGQWTAQKPAKDEAAWTGSRTLDDQEIDRLARTIVTEVGKRGPFLSLADFVNRRLKNDDTGRMGTLQAAIDAAGLNNPFKAAFPLDNSKSLPNYPHPDSIRDATRFEQTLKPDCKVWGIPGYLTQGDLLQVLGPMLTARSDTFIIRTYGDAADADGKVQARAWCEAVVQRCPEPIRPDASGLNPLQSAPTATDMGRRFIVKSFRWLNADEV
jgi:hypothetical protein